MGWGSGGIAMEAIVEAALNPAGLSKVKLLEKGIEALRKLDWDDCFEYLDPEDNDERVVQAFKNLYPEWFEDED